MKGSVRKPRTEGGSGRTGPTRATCSSTKRLTDLSPIDVKRWHGVLLESGKRDGSSLSVASVKLAHRILRRALADAVRWNLIVTNPAAATRVPKGEPKELAVWSAEDARRFLDALADDRLIGLWALALHTGLRRGSCRNNSAARRSPSPSTPTATSPKP